jgi:hypothetical protein
MEPLAVRLLWTVERVDGVVVGTLRSSDRVVNTLATPIVVQFRRPAARDAVEVPLAPGHVWHVPVVTQDSYTVTLRPAHGSADGAHGWAAAPPASHVVQVRTGAREVGDVEAVCAAAPATTITVAGSHPWAVGLRQAFVRLPTGGDASLLAVSSASWQSAVAAAPAPSSSVDVASPGGGVGRAGATAAPGPGGGWPGSTAGGALLYDLCVYAPCEFVNGLPAPLDFQVRVGGFGTGGSSSSSSSMMRLGPGDAAPSTVVVEDRSLAPGLAAAVHCAPSARPEVRRAACCALVAVGENAPLPALLPLPSRCTPTLTHLACTHPVCRPTMPLSLPAPPLVPTVPRSSCRLQLERVAPGVQWGFRRRPRAGLQRRAAQDTPSRRRQP